MSTTMFEGLVSPLNSSSGIQIVLVAITLLILAVPTLTYISSISSYHVSLRYFRDIRPSKAQRPHSPPVLPYRIPVLGHALAFLSTKPGSFHRRMQQQFSANPQVGCITVLLAGQRAHIISSADLVVRLFKTRGISREKFNRAVMVNSNGLGREDELNAYDKVHPHSSDQARMNEEINTKYLLSQNAVNTLTTTFMKTLHKQLKEEPLEVNNEVPLYLFTRDRIFVASTVALYGTEIVKQIPDLNELFWPFENGTLARLFRLPSFIQPKAYEALDAILNRWEHWVSYALSRGGDKLLEGDWDDLMGARVVRERHQMYQKLDLSHRGRASFDLGFLFGLASNAIPAAGWTLCHLVQPSNGDLLKHVLEEVDRATQPDGTIDISILMSSTYLNSCFHETLRCYVDVLVTRALTEDLVLDQYLLKKGDIIIAPSYLGHHDSFWDQEHMPSEDIWYGERFLKHEEKTGKVTFSSNGTNGKFFPFGGGTYICPGRVFAKQEVFGAIATFLATYEVHFERYVGIDKAGKIDKYRVVCNSFPSVKQQFSGSGVVNPEGDVLVKLKRRTG